MQTITVTKTKVEKEGGVVILSLKEYRELSARAVPTYQLYGKEAVALDRLVTQGLKEHAAGKSKTIRSLEDEVLNAMAQQRDTKSARYISHAKAWKQSIK